MGGKILEINCVAKWQSKQIDGCIFALATETNGKQLKKSRNNCSQTGGYPVNESRVREESEVNSFMLLILIILLIPILYITHAHSMHTKHVQLSLLLHSLLCLYRVCAAKQFIPCKEQQTLLSLADIYTAALRIRTVDICSIVELPLAFHSHSFTGYAQPTNWSTPKNNYSSNSVRQNEKPRMQIKPAPLLRAPLPPPHLPPPTIPIYVN